MSSLKFKDGSTWKDITVATNNINGADNSVGGFFKAGRGSISNLSRDTLYNLAPGTYLVSQNAANAPWGETGYANLFIGYSAGNRISAILAYDNNHIYSAYSASSSGTFRWQVIEAVSNLYSSSNWNIMLAGSVGIASAHAVRIGSGSWESVTCPYTLPEQYRPLQSVWGALYTANGGSTTGVIMVENSGKISVRNFGSAGSTNERFGLAAFVCKGGING